MPLDDVGLKQAETLAERFSREKIAAVYSSSLQRALVTATLIARPHGLTVTVLDGLKEINQGELEGKTFEELRTVHAAFMERWHEDPGPVRLPNGESLLELQERAWKEIEAIKNDCPDGEVVAVSHHMTIISILCKFLGLPLSNLRRLKQDLASISIIEFGQRGPVLVCHNDTHHLKELDPNR